MNECDGAYWFFTVEKTGNTESTIQNTDFYTLKTGKKVKPTEVGFKYNILLYKEKEVEYTKAILGDPKGYIERMGKIGYAGLIVKDKSVPKITVKKMLRKVMEDVQIPTAEIRNVLKQV
jgi:hypothetical protein